MYIRKRKKKSNVFRKNKTLKKLKIEVPPTSEMKVYGGIVDN
jgi:hypothetical protein